MRSKSSSTATSATGCGPTCSGFTRPSYRHCRCISDRMFSSCQSGSAGSGRPAINRRRLFGSPTGRRSLDPMMRFTSIRLVEIAALLVLMSFVIYVLIGLMPGDPIDLMRTADPRMSAADVARLKLAYGLDQPLFERYLAWLREALAGDLGYSRLFAAPVTIALVPRLVNSLALMGSSFVIAFLLALGLGIVAARRPRSRLDAAINLFCFARVSVPALLLALV